ncbi:MaoC family dehydratase N-terminal domain-containing protein [Polaromonas sp. P2-4]|nr:MaoC family dehydratase N-terminal domain-containing protein [Polaromonas sp. P2-4]
MIIEKHLEDHVIGESHVTTGRTVTEADIIMHAGQTGDWYPHHVDAPWCATQPFKQRIAHGTLVFSVGIGMAASVINPHSMSYGYDRLRFIRPTFIGDTIRVRTTYKAIREHKTPGHGLLVEGVEVLNQHDEVVLACEHLHLVKRRPGAQTA